MMGIKDVREALKEKTAVIGLKRTMKLMRQGKIKKVFLSANTSTTVKEDIQHYGALLNAAVEELKLTNEELGTLCKRPFSISVIGIKWSKTTSERLVA